MYAQIDIGSSEYSTENATESDEEDLRNLILDFHTNRLSSYGTLDDSSSSNKSMRALTAVSKNHHYCIQITSNHIMY